MGQEIISVQKFNYKPRLISSVQAAKNMLQISLKAAETCPKSAVSRLKQWFQRCSIVAVTDFEHVFIDPFSMNATVSFVSFVLRPKPLGTIFALDIELVTKKMSH